MTISRKIIGGYVAVLAIFLLVSISALYALDMVQKRYGEFIDVKEKLVDGANELRIGVASQIQHYRGLILYPDQQQRYFSILQEDSRDFTAAVEKIRNFALTERESASLDEIAKLRADLDQKVNNVIELVQHEKIADAIAMAEVDLLPRARALTDKAEKLRDAQLDLVSRQRVELGKTMDRIAIAITLVSLVGLLFGIAFSIYLSRAITRQLRETIAQLTTSSTEILATTTQVASGAAETATAVSETTTTVEEVKQTVELANQKARLVSDNAQQAAEVSLTGRQAVDEMIGRMNWIREQTASTAESIVKLSEQGQVIGEIIATVNDLAEQSNLLAVNAAIEAAKAGDQGKGFTVVAQEIKSLAEQSKQATAQVRAILGDIQKATRAAVIATDLSGKAVEAGAEQSDAAGEAIRMLAENIVEAAQAAMQIAASSQQQMVGMNQVALAMENIKQASTQNMAGTRQAEAAAQNLHELGNKLKQLVGQS